MSNDGPTEVVIVVLVVVVGVVVNGTGLSDKVVDVDDEP